MQAEPRGVYKGCVLCSKEPVDVTEDVKLRAHLRPCFQ
jgi:hypothetical protein